MQPTDHPYIFHLVQARLWDDAVDRERVYFPPTYDSDGFTHGTANPAKLLTVANHFYQNVAGDWYCLQMTIDSLLAAGIETVFEGTAPVGDIEPEFEGSDDELFPHIQGGIPPIAVLRKFAVRRASDGTFVGIETLVETP
ncbi:MAG: DUF952 domain-containing protein [Pseudomonadota bacterium]